MIYYGVWKNNGGDSGCYIISMYSNGQVDTVDKSPNEYCEACIPRPWNKLWFEETNTVYLW